MINTTKRVASVIHGCGEVIPTTYYVMADVFLNPAWCPRCMTKFVPHKVQYADHEDDGSIAATAQAHRSIKQVGGTGNE